MIIAFTTNIGTSLSLNNLTSIIQLLRLWHDRRWKM